MPSKICSKCKQQKDTSRFSPSKDALFGVHSVCKVCRSKNHDQALNREEYLKSVEGISKLCHKCEQTKPLSEFTRDSAKREGHNNECKQCKRQKAHKRAYNQSYTEIQSGRIETCASCSQSLDISVFFRKRKNKFYLTKKCKTCRGGWPDKRRIKMTLIIESGRFCSLCGYDGKTNPAAMDFHHKDPHEKDFNVSSRTDLLSARKEASKCILLCSNCHRGLHAGSIQLK